MNHRPLFFIALLLTGSLLSAQEDIGACVGVSGSIVSHSASAWSCLAGEGPGGVDCIVSGSPADPWESSVAEYSTSGPGVLSFQWRCSSAPGDWLSVEAQVPGGFMEITGISGEQDWQEMQVFVPAGTTKVRWVYRNFANGNDGEDAGRVALVQWHGYPDYGPGSFPDWLMLLGLPADTTHAANGLRMDTCFITGLDPNMPVPPGFLTPVVEASAVRFRVPLTKSARGALRVESTTGTGGWSHYGITARLVPDTDAGNSLVMEYTVPRAAEGRQLLRCHHTPWLVPPEGFVLVPEGTFMMGSPQDEPGHHSIEGFQHQVTLTRSYFIKKSETTYAEFVDTQTWARANGYPRLAIKTNTGVDEDMAQNGKPGEGRDESGPHPVVDVNWFETLKWLNAKSERDGLQPCYKIRLNNLSVETYRNQDFSGLETNPPTSPFLCDWDASGWRLPSEAEWEYACRAGTETGLYSGNEVLFWRLDDPVDPFLDTLAWYRENSGDMTHPIGQKLPNPFGLYDMYGNAGEWTWDTLHDIRIIQFGPEPVTDPTGPAITYIDRAGRGGNIRLSGQYIRSSARVDLVSTIQGGGLIGFRYCRTVR